MSLFSFRTQYRKFRTLTSKFFSYWFFIVFATIGVGVAVVERLTGIFGAAHLEPLMILIITYAILVYIVTERAKVLDDIHDRTGKSTTLVYPTREAVYLNIPLIVARTAANGQGRRRIFHAALHGTSARRIARPVPGEPMFEMFEREIDKCAASAGPGMWHVYEIFNIPDEERLEAVEELLERRKDGEGYEVRAFLQASGLPHLSPLVIGDEDLLIGLDDPRYYRAGSAMHLRGRDPVRLATEYFYSLWNDSRIRVLKTETGIDRGQIELVRAELREAGREASPQAV